jgi:hypothetical protein
MTGQPHPLANPRQAIRCRRHGDDGPKALVTLPGGDWNGGRAP